MDTPKRYGVPSSNNEKLEHKPSESPLLSNQAWMGFLDRSPSKQKPIAYKRTEHTRHCQVDDPISNWEPGIECVFDEELNTNTKSDAAKAGNQNSKPNLSKKIQAPQYSS